MQQAALSSFGHVDGDGLIMTHGTIFKVVLNLSEQEAWAGWRMTPKGCGMENLSELFDSINPFKCMEPDAYCWRATAYVNMDVMQFIYDNVLGANQERIDVVANATRPTATRLARILKDKGYVSAHEGDNLALFKYCILVEYLATTWAEGRLFVKQSVGQGVIGDLFDHVEQEADDDKEDPDRVDVCKPYRTSFVGPRPLRNSVRTKEVTTDEMEDALQRQKATPNDIPDGDGPPVNQSTNTQIGPEFVKCAASVNPKTKESEMSSLSRHFPQENLPKHTEKAQKNFDSAIAIMKKAIKREFEKQAKKGDYKEKTLPTKWSPETKAHAEEMASEERLHTNSAFTKSGEIGLDPEKRDRMIITGGTDDAGANAAYVGPFEKGFCKAFPQFVTKGLTTGQTDKKLYHFLTEAILRSETKSTSAKCSSSTMRTHKVHSVDFSAMDSTWTLHEKAAIVDLVMECAEILMDESERETVKAFDPRLDVKNGKIYLKMRHHNVEVSDQEAILFSGERGTSIYNRLLVLAICTAEVIRVKGVRAAEQMWKSQTFPLARTVVSDEKCSDEMSDEYYLKKDAGDELTTGDGDDMTWCTDLYKDAQDMIESFKCYGKNITCVCDPTCRKVEVLSRFHMKTRSNKEYSLVKVKKNMQRTVLATTKNPAEIGEINEMTGMQHAELATSLFYKTLAAKQTPGIRWYTYHIAVMRMEMAIAKQHLNTAYDVDLQRKRQMLDELTYPDGAPTETLNALEERVRTALEEAEMSVGVMVEWANFGAPHMPVGTNFEAAKADWWKFDNAAKERVISIDDVSQPEVLLADLEISPWIARYIGVSPELMKCLHAGRIPSSTHGQAGRYKAGNKCAGSAGVKLHRNDGGIRAKAEGALPRSATPYHGHADGDTAPGVKSW